MKFIISLLIPLAAGLSAGFFTRKEIAGWFSGLEKPWFNPPNWVFSPVWTTLYILMGIAMWLVWKSKMPESLKKTALFLYAIQLVLNFFWSLLFFNLHQTGWALAEILVMWVFIFLTILAFARVDKTAAWLMVPYICWVSFASILNYSIWELNK